MLGMGMGPFLPSGICAGRVPRGPLAVLKAESGTWLLPSLFAHPRRVFVYEPRADRAGQFLRRLWAAVG